MDATELKRNVRAIIKDNSIERFIIGGYFQGQPIYDSFTVICVANSLYASPIVVPRDMTVDRIAIQVTTADAGKIARLGLYTDNGNFYPANLVIDAGTVSCDAVAVVAATINVKLPQGIYWGVAVSDGTPTLEVVYPCQSRTGQSTFAKTGNYSGYIKAAVGSGALPNAFPSGASIDTQYFRAICLRILSLD